TNNYLNWPNILSGTTGAEAFVVLKVSNSRPALAAGLWRIGGSYPQGAVGGAYPDISGSIYYDFGLYSDAAADIGGRAQPLDQFHVYEVAAQSGSWTAWINGQMQFTAKATSYGQYWNYYYLGTTGARFFVGDIAEVLIFNRPLTAMERVTV